MRSRLTAVGDASLPRWGRKVADPVSRAVSRRTRLSPEQVRAILGFTFLVISIYALVKRAREAMREV